MALFQMEYKTLNIYVERSEYWMKTNTRAKKTTNRKNGVQQLKTRINRKPAELHNKANEREQPLDEKYNTMEICAKPNHLWKEL